MTAPSPTPREERFKTLSDEIDILILRFGKLPPGRTQELCQLEIDSRLKQIDALNAEQYAEDLASSQQAPPAPSRGTAGQRQVAVVGMVIIVVGLLFHAYTVLTMGSVIVLICMGAMHQSGRRTSPAPPPPEPVRERFQWHP